MFGVWAIQNTQNRILEAGQIVTKIWTAYLFCTFTRRRDDPHATRERVYRVRSAPMFRVNINGDIVIGLPDRLTAHF
jgi:hypothetical protein